MIESARRFHGQSSLRYVYAKGQSVRGTVLSLRYVYNSRQLSYRAAVVVSRKVHKSAVVRNRVRRRIYEIVRKNAERITKPYDLVVTVHGQEVADMPHAALERLLIGQLDRAGVLGVKADSAPEKNHAIVGEKETHP